MPVKHGTEVQALPDPLETENQEYKRKANLWKELFS